MTTSRHDMTERSRPLSFAARPGPGSALAIQLLGTFRIGWRDRVVEPEAWRLRKAGHLIKLLALAPGHRLHREQIFEHLWPELNVDAAANNLRVTLYAIRKLFEEHCGRDLHVLQLRNEQLVLATDHPVWTDVESFEQAAASARASNDPAAFEAAAALYSGDLLPEDRFEDWVHERRESLRRTYTALLHQLAELSEERGAFDRAIEALQELLGADPANEPAHVMLMRLYAKVGRRTQAIRQYQQLREALQRELDIEPDPASTRIYEAILAGERERAKGRVADEEVRAGAGRGTSRLHWGGSVTRKANLPVPLTSLIGREQEITTVTQSLVGTRLLTLTGPGGSGKTRLAVEAASSMADSYPDGVVWIELAGLSNPTLVPHAVAAALKVREAQGLMSDALIGFLSGRAALLILDNCEHLIEACAELAEQILSACPFATILATSREPLRITGEMVWPVPGLTTPDLSDSPDADDLLKYESVRLFCERARLARPDFVLTSDNAEAVSRICASLDGMPLAIELAAGRMRALSAGQIANRLGDILPILSGGDRTRTPRQQTLREAIGWSYRLLSETEQRLFRHLATFAGSFELSAVEAVWQAGEIDPDAALDLLFHLVDKSLVMVEERDGTVRYRLLETIRQFAEQQLRDAGETDLARRRYLDWSVRLVEEAELELWNANQRSWLSRLDAERDNLRSTLAWSLERAPVEGLRIAAHLWWYWRVRGQFIEGRHWLGKLLDAAPGAETIHAKALLGIGILTAFQGDRLAARPYLERALALSRALDDRRGIGWALANLGLLMLSEDDYEQAHRSLAEGLALLRAVDDRPGISWTLDILGDLSRLQEDLEQASAWYQEGLAVHRDMGDARGIGWMLLKLGNVARIQRDYAAAEAYLEESSALIAAIGDPWDTGWETGYRGILALARGDLDDSRRLLSHSLEIFNRAHDRLGSAYCLHFYGLLLIQLADFARGVRMLAAAETVRKPLGIWLTSRECAELLEAEIQAQAALGHQTYTAAWEAGRAMTLEQAINDVLAGASDQSGAID